MLTNRVTAFVLFSILTIGMLIVGCGKKEAEVFKFGVVVPLTGNAANYGKSAQQGIDLAVKEINANGGILGRKIAPIYEDSKALGKEGATVTQKLVTVDKVSAIVGGIVSAVTLASAPICEGNKVVWLSPSSSAPAITNAGDYIFRNWPSDEYEGKIMSDYLLSKGHKRVAILQVQTDYGEGIAGVFKRNFEQGGGTVVLLDKYNQQESNFRSLLAKVRSANPNVIYCIGYYTDAALAIKQARELGLKQTVVTTTTVEDPQFLNIGGAAVEGVVYPLASGYDEESSDSVVVRFKSNFRTEYGEDPGFVAANCYDCVYLIKKAIEFGNGFTGTEIKNGLHKVQNYPGVTGITSFDKNGDVIKDIRMKIVRNGKFVAYRPEGAE
jgi:branched-chain amino acid transport system substrate-binding protein